MAEAQTRPTAQQLRAELNRVSRRRGGAVFGRVLLIVLFLGSSRFGEEISASKYPEYATYRKRVSKFIPWKKYEA